MCLALAAVSVLAGGCAAAGNAAPRTARLESAAPTTAAPGNGQTYPAKGTSYVVVPDGDQLVWTDLKTGAHGHFGPADGSELSSPSVSADGRRITFTQLPPLPSVQNLLADGYEPSAGYWDLDTRSGGTLRPSAGIGWTVTSRPSISPDGTRVALAPSSGIYLAAVGGARLPIRLLPTVAQEVAWDGDDALAYLPALGHSNDCAVERVTLSAAATRCLLPTATLQSLPASNGAGWQIDDVTGSGDPSLLTLDMRAHSPGGSTAQAVAILDPSAEATPLHVLADTITTSPPVDGVQATSRFSVLVDQGSQVLYTVNAGPGSQAKIFQSSINGGAPRRVGISPGMGLGATSE
ncbi:MAG: hypothetical protein ACRDRL_23005 [Sciscionella sp.]